MADPALPVTSMCRSLLNTAIAIRTNSMSTKTWPMLLFSGLGTNCAGLEIAHSS